MQSGLNETCNLIYDAMQRCQQSLNNKTSKITIIFLDKDDVNKLDQSLNICNTYINQRAKNNVHSINDINITSPVIIRQLIYNRLLPNNVVPTIIQTKSSIEYQEQFNAELTEKHKYVIEVNLFKS